jgi:hypothetical protein
MGSNNQNPNIHNLLRIMQGIWVKGCQITGVGLYSDIWQYLVSISYNMWQVFGLSPSKNMVIYTAKSVINRTLHVNYNLNL